MLLIVVRGLYCCPLDSYMSFKKGRAVVNLQQSGSKKIFGFLEKFHL